MAWLSGLLASIIRPILQEELRGLKAFAFDQYQRLESYKKFEQEAADLIERAAKATTSEERWAHVERLRASRARLR
jgi:hypothetical protein